MVLGRIKCVWSSLPAQIGFWVTPWRTRSSQSLVGVIVTSSQLRDETTGTGLRLTVPPQEYSPGITWKCWINGVVAQGKVVLVVKETT